MLQKFLHTLFLVALTTQEYDYDKPSQLLLEVTDQTFPEIISSSQYFLLDFYMSRKDMVIPMDPTHARSTFIVAEKLSHLKMLKFGKIETKANPVTSQELKIIPAAHATKVLFKNGKVVDMVDRTSRDTYNPAVLQNWIEKRVVGPIAKEKVPELSLEEAAVLTLTTPSPLLSAASLKLTQIRFYQQTGDVEHNGRILLEGETYILRNFIGETTVEALEVSGTEEEMVEKISHLSTPLLQHISAAVLNEVYLKEQWALGLLVSGSVAEHNSVFTVFISALKGLKEMIPGSQELRGVYLINKKTEEAESDTDGGFDMERDRFERLVKHLQIDEDRNEGPTIFLFKSNGMGRGIEPDRATMKTDLTEHNIKSFFFEQVQQKLLEDKMAKKRKAVKQGEAIPLNWRDKKIKHIVRDTLQDWITENNADVLILICHGTQSSSLTKLLLSISKLEKQYGGKIQFGKVNTGLNDLDLPEIPTEGFVRLRGRSDGQILMEIISNVLDIQELTDYISSSTSVRSKEEL
ncbi:hypothetical protein ACHWQZ_G004343 [Mnemiopsis leidyi]